MKKFFHDLFFIFLLVVYIYSIVFDAFPLSSKIILEVVGLLYCIKYIVSNNYRLKKDFKIVLYLILALVFWDIATSLMNGRTEFHLIKDIAPVLGGVFAAELIYSYASKQRRDPSNFLYLVVFTVFAESILTVLMKLYPSLYSMIDSVLVFDFGTDNFSDIYEIARFFGIGNAHYFGVLPSCALGVMTAVFLLNYSHSLASKFFIMITWIVIAITSFFVARWSVTVVGLSLGLFILNQNGKNIIKSFGLIVGLIVVVFISYKIVMNNADEDLLQWALSFFIDPSSSSDNSADRVMGWWANTSFELKTFIVGDAQYVDPNGGYYKHVDIGYFREIFYGGVICLLLNLYTHAKILKMTYKYNKTRQFKLFLSFLFFSYLAILGKGDANMMSFFILYLVFYSGGVFERVSSYK